jgi:hypothetical protein
VVINHKKKKDEWLLKDHLQRSSYRILESKTGVAKKTACKRVNAMAGELIHSNDLSVLLNLQNFSGIITLDGKYGPVKELEEQIKRLGLIPRSGKRRGKTKKGLVTLPFMDYYTHDIPIFIIALSENSWDIEVGFHLLKAIGYPLRGIVCDESMGLIAQVARKVFPEVVIQFCLTHYSKCIDRCFQAKGAKRSYRALERRLKSLEDSFLISTRHHDRGEAVRLTNEMAKLEFEYGYLWRVEDLFAELFWSAKTVEEINQWEDLFNEIVEAVPKNYPYRNRIKDRYNDYYEKRDFILASVIHSEVKLPKTTNLIEGFNSTTLEIRFTSIRGFEKEKYARAYINALILNYRFHKFTDCKKQFKPLNGKSPLQIANPLNTFGFDFAHDDWIPFCKNLKKSVKSQPPK